MHPFPHHYAVTATLHKTGDLMLFTEGTRVIESAPPKEFDGPGNQWSPETLLTAAVADCFALSFRAIATASKFAWTSLSVKTEGTLDRVEGTARFTRGPRTRQEAVGKSRGDLHRQQLAHRRAAPRGRGRGRLRALLAGPRRDC